MSASVSKDDLAAFLSLARWRFDRRIFSFKPDGTNSYIHCKKQTNPGQEYTRKKRIILVPFSLSPFFPLSLSRQPRASLPKEANKNEQRNGQKPRPRATFLRKRRRSFASFLRMEIKKLFRSNFKDVLC